MLQFWNGLLWIALLLFLGSSCMKAYRQSAGGDPHQVHSRIYFTDFNTSWQAALDALKSSRLDISNREGGFIQTRWADNTAEKNFTDSFVGGDIYLKTQYRFRVTVAPGAYQGRQAIKVSVQKEQLIQRDVLEGWKPIETDSVEENTLLYRIGRLIFLRMKITALEEEKAQERLEQEKQVEEQSSTPEEQSAPTP